MTVPAAWHWIIPLFALGIAVATDLRNFRIPNWLTLPLLIGGLFCHAICGGPFGFLVSMLGATVGFVMLFPLYHVGAMGAGDIKLMAALGAWLRLPATLEVLAVSCLLTALVSLLMVIRRRLATADLVADSAGSEPLGDVTEGTRLRVESVASRSDRRGRLIPFAVMLACGVVVVLFRTFWS